MYGKDLTSDLWTIQKLCQDQGKNKHDRHLDQKVKERIKQALLKCFILENSGIIR